MRAIGFDFMARKIKQRITETFAKRARRNVEKKRTIEEVQKARKHAELLAKLKPVTQRGSSWFKGVTEGGMKYNRPGTRQGKRRLARMAAFEDMSVKYPGEVRRVRRSMAFDLVRRQWKAQVEARVAARVAVA